MLDILLLWYPTKRERQTVDHQYEVYFSRRFESPDNIKTEIKNKNDLCPDERFTVSDLISIHNTPENVYHLTIHVHWAGGNRKQIVSST